jgi:hypothetical protein
VLRNSDEIVATSDNHVLARAQRWLNLARLTIDLRVHDAWIVDFSS